ncbi:MAG: DUF692 domain-containing protein [Rhodobacteraceae bacterium]|nr:DUF692 domain-containing protein [Paracoccaceae bacterium]
MAASVGIRHGEALPPGPGVGYKAVHFSDIVSHPGSVEWLEIHAENYMGEGGRPLAQLRRLRRDFPFSCHGVGLSIGGEEPLDKEHLARLKHLNGWLQPAVFSEHLAWSTHEGHYYNDLLPVPYTREAQSRVCSHIDEIQDTLGRRMLLENPSTYIEFAESEMSEIDFISGIADQTGCGLLLDVNNVHVSAVNHERDAEAYIDAYPLHAVEEIHLGGHEGDEDDDGNLLLIDNHASEVVDPVWELFRRVTALAGPIPTLIEWDNDVPDWATLEAEAQRAGDILACGAARIAA